MARPCAYCSPWQNSFPAGKNELADAASTKGNSTPIPTLAVSHILTSALHIALFLDNKLFKQFIKLYLEAQVSGQIKADSKPRKQPFKTQFSDLYYGNLQMDCYYFC